MNIFNRRKSIILKNLGMNKQQFLPEQMQIIQEGCLSGLSDEEINTYADPEYSWQQMYEILTGFKNGLSLEQVKSYANPKFNCYQMEEIREGLKDKLSQEQASLYTDPEFSYSQMHEIRTGLKMDLPIEFVKIYANHKYSAKQMKEIRLGFETQLTIDQIKTYANPVFDWEQMREIRYGFAHNLPAEAVSTYAKADKPAGCMEIKRLALEMTYLTTEISDDQIALYTGTNTKYNPEQKQEIYFGIKNGLSLEQIQWYADPRFHYLQMKEIRYGLEDNYPIAIYANYKFDHLQMREIRLGFKNGLTLEQIKQYTDVNNSAAHMKTTRELYQKTNFKGEKIMNDIPRCAYDVILLESDLEKGMDFSIIPTLKRYLHCRSGRAMLVNIKGEHSQAIGFFAEDYYRPGYDYSGVEAFIQDILNDDTKKSQNGDYDYHGLKIMMRKNYEEETCDMKLVWHLNKGHEGIERTPLWVTACDRVLYAEDGDHNDIDYDVFDYCPYCGRRFKNPEENVVYVL